MGGGNGRGGEGREASGDVRERRGSCGRVCGRDEEEKGYETMARWRGRKNHGVIGNEKSEREDNA